MLNHRISLLCILEKNNGPSAEPCGTPEEYCLFGITLCFRSCKKSLTMFNKLPDIPFSLGFRRIPLYQTLSKAFDMSRNIPLAS